MKCMTVKDLRVLIAGMEAGALVVTPTTDHAYMPAQVALGVADFNEDDTITEAEAVEVDMTKEQMERQHKVLIIG